MWRCQLYYQREDAIPCCGNKECESILLASCSKEGDILYSAHELVYKSGNTIDISNNILPTCTKAEFKMITIQGGLSDRRMLCVEGKNAWTGYIQNIRYMNSGCFPNYSLDSRWYGTTVFTNYENCQREKGSFVPLKIQYKQATGSYSSSTSYIYVNGKRYFCDIAGKNRGLCTIEAYIDVGYCTIK